MVLLVFAITLVFVIILIRFKVPIAAILGLAAVLLMLLYNNSLAELLKVVVESVTSLETNRLVVTVYSIIILGKIMSSSGSIKNMAASIEKIFPRSGIAAAILPAIIGLLPMPGGALLSAPMVGNVEAIKSHSPKEKAAINYWFRHGWEFIWPLYPGIIMASALSGVSIRTIITYQLPMAVIFIVVGLIKFRKSVVATKKNDLGFHQNMQSLYQFLKSIMPVLLVVILNLVFGLDILIALIIIIFLTAITYAKSLAPFSSTLKSFANFETFWLIEAVMVLKNAVGSSGLSSELTSFLSQSDMLVPALTATLAFAIGLITGMTTAFVGVAFPLIPPLIGPENSYGIGFLTYTCGFVGVMLSPTHLCLLLSRDYFKAELSEVYKTIMIPIITVLIIGISIFAVLYN